jgi:hypothetical protein
MEQSNEKRVRKAGIVAGIGLLLMAILAGYGNLGIIATLVVDGDAAKTAANIQESLSLFRMATLFLFIVAILDVVVGWALYRFFEPVNKKLSAAAASLRIIYAVIFTAAIYFLYSASTVLSQPTEVLRNTDQFNLIWQGGLILFGIHLLLIGYLVIKAKYTPIYLGILLIVAGLGYMIDGVGNTMVSGYSLNIGAVTFIGEVVLIFWLLIRGRKITL